MRMTTKLTSVMMMTVILLMASCSGDDEKPQTAPTVKTLTAVSTGTSGATVTGEITNDGNAKITEAGFVYGIANLPTTSDTKKTIDDLDNFTAEISGLTSGTVYNIRAYAINKKGTSYGEQLTVETGNLGPVATNVLITGVAAVGEELTASYSYTDAESDPEDQDGTTYKWYSANDAIGTGEVLIDGATEETFTIGDAQQGKFIRVGVTPRASDGTLTGTEAKSNFTTAVGAETVTFMYNGASVTYGVIKSETTQRKWLDRNLGASRVAQSATDYQAYGDMYQWGRLRDGHEGVTRTNGTDAGATGVTGTTSTQSTVDIPPTNKFITDTSLKGDWRNPQNNNLWQGVNGVNNPCPAGWRIATEAEWTAENVTNITIGFDKLKLTYNGARDLTSGDFSGTGTIGTYWASTVQAADPVYAVQLYISDSFTTIWTNNRGYGSACRCTKD